MFPRHMIHTDVPIIDTDNYTLSIDQNTLDWNLAAMLGPVSAASVVSIYVRQGVVVQANSVKSYALNLRNALPAGSTIRLYNSGYIDGRGGHGGRGGGWIDQTDSYENASRPSAGQDGGIAILGPGADISFEIVNGAGRIRGGGGGGGGGGFSVNNAIGPIPNGGGGGGGAGGGAGGQGNRFGHDTADPEAADGVDGGTGVTGTYGAGGAGNETGAAEGGDGGQGGDWGQDGQDGASPTTYGNDVAGAAGGSGGAAIDNDSETVTFLSGGSAPNVQGDIL